ncbi:hypothetical protein ASF18_17940 [Methylobacterium sp. Leaf89]|nr:hypothetical protein ASF18_17940 [Methylobacterium sp. Leaf89]
MAEEGSSIDTEHGSSPASRGAAGAYIEGELGALYLLALLTGNRAPGLPDARVTSVRFQGVEQGFKLDDLIIKGVGARGDALLEIQSKRDIQFSPKDAVYKDVAHQIASSTIDDVPAERHLFGIATQRTSRKISGAYQDVLGWARSAETAYEFFTRLGAKGVANDDMRAFVATTRAHLVAGGVADEDEAIWRLLRRMLILEFDFEASAPIARTYGLALARMALADEQVARAEALWSRLVDISIQTGTRGGEIDAAALKANLAEADFKLAGERDYGPARARLAELAHNTLAPIGTSVAGVTLPRLMAVAALDEAAETQRFIVVRGEPFIAAAQTIADKGCAALSAWEDGRKLPEILAGLRAAQALGEPTPPELIDAVQAGVSGLLATDLDPDDITRILAAADNHEGSLPPELFAEIEGATQRMIEELPDNLGHMDSESTLEDWGKTIEKLAARFHGDPRVFERAHAALKQRTTQLRETEAKDTEASFTGAADLPGDKFDDAALASLFGSLGASTVAISAVDDDDLGDFDNLPF